MAHVAKVKVSLKLSRLSAAFKIEKTRHYVTEMTGNPNFATPPADPISPPLATITTAVNNFETAVTNALGGGTTETAIMHEMETIHDNLVTQLGHYVEDTSNDNPALAASILLSSGMDIRPENQPIGPLPQPVNFSAKTGSVKKTIDLNCDTMRGGKAYIWAQTSTPTNPSSYVPVNGGTGYANGVSTKSKITATNLTSGTEYTFKLTALGAAGESPFIISSPVIAP